MDNYLLLEEFFDKKGLSKESLDKIMFMIFDECPNIIYESKYIKKYIKNYINKNNFDYSLQLIYYNKFITYSYKIQYNTYIYKLINKYGNMDLNFKNNNWRFYDIIIYYNKKLNLELINFLIDNKFDFMSCIKELVDKMAHNFNLNIYGEKEIAPGYWDYHKSMVGLIFNNRVMKIIKQDKHMPNLIANTGI
jgi:hypothetical protein